MKPIFVVCISALLIGHTLGYYLPVNYGVNGKACECGAKTPEYDYRAAAPEGAADDVKYKFDFELQQPKEQENAGAEPKSYNYQIQTPPSEIEPENTKYKFDYTLQAPVEEQPVEKPEQVMYTKVDKMTQDKPECSCRQGAACSCGYSPEQCAVHCNSRSPSYNSDYVLPVQYDNSGDFVVYEFPQQPEYLNRRARQAPMLPASGDSPLAPLNERISALINSDTMRAATDAIRQRADAMRERFSKMADGSGGEDRVGASLDVSSLKDRFSSIADKIGSHFGSATDLVKGFAETFSNPQRKKRDVTRQGERRNDDKRIPMLRVEEYKERENRPRVELETAAEREQEWNSKDAEKSSQCHKCGAKLTDSACKRCGEHQPQYFEYIEGKPVSFYPGAQRNDQESPRYIYDRYGHKYLENNGNLRLISPLSPQEPMVKRDSGDQPNYAGLAEILNQNQEVMRAINTHPGRMLPQPVDLLEDGIEVIRTVARRDVDVANEKTPESRYALPRTMYQVVPMKYDGKDGKLVVKVYSAKNDKTKIEQPKQNDELSMVNRDAETNMTEKSKPTIKKFTKNHRAYEIISFDDYKGNSDEDIRQVLDHIYGKKSL